VNGGEENDGFQHEEGQKVVGKELGKKSVDLLKCFKQIVLEGSGYVGCTS